MPHDGDEVVKASLSHLIDPCITLLEDMLCRRRCPKPVDCGKSSNPRLQGSVFDTSLDHTIPPRPHFTIVSLHSSSDHLSCPIPVRLPAFEDLIERSYVRSSIRVKCCLHEDSLSGRDGRAIWLQGIWLPYLPGSSGAMETSMMRSFMCRMRILALSTPVYRRILKSFHEFHLLFLI